MEKKVSTEYSPADFELRAKAVGAWWIQTTGRDAPVLACRRIASFDVDFAVLQEHLQSVYDHQVSIGDEIRTLHWFSRPEGISRLHRLQSESHSRRGGESRGGSERLAASLQDWAR